MPGIKLVQPKHRELTGGDLLAQCLRDIGVEVAFGIHGGHLDAFLMGCSDASIRLIDTRHETVAVQAAEGYAKVKGKLGVAFVTSNSGFVNGLPGFASAMADRSPILIVTSSPPMRDTETNTIQGFIDQIDVGRRLTKYAQKVSQPEEIPRFVAHAYRAAVSGAPGPVLLDFPCDVLFRPVVQSRIEWGAISSPLPHPPAPAPKAIRLAIEMWRNARRPAIVVGSGGRNPEVAKKLVELVKLTGSPIFHGVKYRHWNLVDPKYDGGAANHLGFMAAMNKPQPDLVILLACRTGMYFGGRNGFIPPTEDCKYIQVDTDGGEIGRTRPIDVGIVADLSEVLSALCHEIAHTPFHTDPAWIEIAVNTQREVVAPASKEPTDISPGRMNVYHALKEAFSSLEPGSIICIDGGETSLWGADLLPFARPHLSFGALGYLVLLGNGFGWSLGAAIADPSRQVVNLQGDGSAGFHFSSLDTYARFQLNILTVVVNNAVWAMSIHGQELFYGEKDPARNVSRLSPETRYDIIAEGFGNAAAMVNKFDEIRGEVKRLSQDPRPACLNLIVAETPIHPATKAFMNENPDPNVINVPYYDSIPRPFYKV